MSSPNDVKTIIQSFAERHQTGLVSYTQFVAYIDRYILENPEKERVLDELLRMGGKYLNAHIETLEKEGFFKVNRSPDGIQSILYQHYFIKAIEQAYQRLDDKPEVPFPTEDSIRLSIPPEDLKVIEIKNDFIHWIQRSEEPSTILRISFPDGIQAMICTNQLLGTRVLAGAVYKIRHYLRDSKNLAYMRQKLTPIFRGREIAVKDMLHNIVTSPDQSLQTILEPSDFTFQLWTQLSTNLVKEYGPKTDKLAEEHGFCQAAYLIGYYNMHHRTKVQKRKEEEASLNFLMQNLRKPPYAYKISQIYEFTDDKGLLLVKRCDKERINEFIQEKCKAQGDKDIPEVLMFSTRTKEDYYIPYPSVPQYLSDNLIRAQKDMRDFYKRSWQIALRASVEFTTMHKDDAFRAHVEQRLQRHFPALESLLTFPVVYLASRIEGIPPQARLDINDILVPNAQRLKAMEQIMKLSRKRMLEDAKIMLPAWMVIPVVRELVGLVRTLFLGREMAERTITQGFDHEGQERMVRATRKNKVGQGDEGDAAKNLTPPGKPVNPAQAYRAAAKAMESSFIQGNEDLGTVMMRYLDRWNQILDPRAKADLTADVNGLCRDYLRKQRVLTRATPPEADLIRTYAEKLVESDLLRGIKNKRDLQKYIELYFLSVLQTV